MVFYEGIIGGIDRCAIHLNCSSCTLLAHSLQDGANHDPNQCMDCLILSCYLVAKWNNSLHHGSRPSIATNKLQINMLMSLQNCRTSMVLASPMVSQPGTNPTAMVAKVNTQEEFNNAMDAGDNKSSWGKWVIPNPTSFDAREQQMPLVCTQG